MKVAIYDLDKTLVRRATFTPFLAFAAGQVAPWRLVLLPVWVLMMIGYRIGFYDRTTLKTAGMKVMVGPVAVSKLEEIGKRFAARHIERAGWIRSVIELLEEDRSSGAQIAIATAAFEFYAKAFAQKLGIEHVIATRWDGQGIPGGNCYGEEKRQRVLKWLGAEALPDDVRFVSDSFADAPLLEDAADAIFVTPSKGKASRAQQRGWRVIEP